MDVSELEDVAEEFEVRSVPTIVGLKDGKCHLTYVGSKLDTLLDRINGFIGSAGGEQAAVAEPESHQSAEPPAKRARTDASASSKASSSNALTQKAMGALISQHLAPVLTHAGTVLQPSHLTLVRDSLSAFPPPLSRRDVQQLYEYPVPALSADGTCSASSGLAAEPFSLRSVLEVPGDAIERHPTTVRLWRLRRVVQGLADSLGVEWVGVYRRCHPAGQEAPVLCKEAYVGAPSRAFFPLTQEFARTSNNSTVGLTGNAQVYRDVSSLAEDAPYYPCDSRVKFEVCAPIVAPGGDVIGIVDVEAWRAHHLTDAGIALIFHVCRELGDANLGL